MQFRVFINIDISQDIKQLIHIDLNNAPMLPLPKVVIRIEWQYY